jgi:hypothetical protein
VGLLKSSPETLSLAISAGGRTLVQSNRMGEPNSPAHRRYARLFVSDEDFEDFKFASQAALAAAIEDAFMRIASAGMEWLRNPHSRNESEWKAIGIYFTGSTKPLSPHVPNLPG